MTEQQAECLKPCPFCGKSAISSGESLACDSDGLGKQTGCESCGALGPIARVTDEQASGPEGDELADAAWNRRAALSEARLLAGQGVPVAPKAGFPTRAQAIKALETIWEFGRPEVARAKVTLRAFIDAAKEQP